MASNSPKNNSAGSSAEASRTQSFNSGVRPAQLKAKHNVKFSVLSESDEQSSPKRHSLPEIHLPEESSDIAETVLPLPADNVDWTRRKDAAAHSAQAKASRHADKVKRHYSAPNSRRSSFDEGSTAVGSTYASPSQKPVPDANISDIPLAELTSKLRTRNFDLPHDTTDEDSDDDDNPERKLEAPQRQDSQHFSEARRLVKAFTGTGGFLTAPAEHHRSGTATPLIDQRSHEYDYVPRPDEFKPSVLSMLLAARASSPDMHSNRQDAQQEQSDYLAAKLAAYQDPQTDPRKKYADFFHSRKKHMPRSPGNLSGAQTPLDSSPGQSSASGQMTPKQRRPKWYKDENKQWQSSASLGKLIESSFNTVIDPTAAETTMGRPPLLRNASSGRLSARELIKHPISHIRNISSSSNIRRTAATQVAHDIAQRLESQAYIIEMCKALMSFGAPTHRLEEFLLMATRKLQIHASFQYLPSCMIISFDDPTTHTSEIKLVKQPAAVNLGKLMEVQQVYKDVMHDKYSIADAIDDLVAIRDKRKRWNNLHLIITYGIAAVAVGPFAFSAQPMDFPLSFALGCLLGYLQIFGSRSAQFMNIFEVFGTFITSFAARGLGSINWSDGTPMFCFGALAQSSIALILPGWIILSASLELQSRNIIAGSIRMVYAIIYTLLLVFGTLLGTTLMGLFYPGATSETTCHLPDYWYTSTPKSWKIVYIKFLWVPIFTICLAVINQAKVKQMLPMVVIACCAYLVNFWSNTRFSEAPQVPNALGAFTIGVMAHLYSRVRHGVAAAAMLPAIFVMVPSGLAANGGLIAGLQAAQTITGNTTGESTSSTSESTSGTIFTVGYNMVQIAIAISAGLFLSALVIYPFGKKRSGIFSF